MSKIDFKQVFQNQLAKFKCSSNTWVHVDLTAVAVTQNHFLHHCLHDLDQDQSRGQTARPDHTPRNTPHQLEHISSISRGVCKGILDTGLQWCFWAHAWLQSSSPGDSGADVHAAASSDMGIKKSHREPGRDCKVGGQGGLGQKERQGFCWKCDSWHCPAGWQIPSRCCHRPHPSIGTVFCIGCTLSVTSRSQCKCQCSPSHHWIQDHTPGIEKHGQHRLAVRPSPESFDWALPILWQPLLGLTPCFWVQKVHWRLVTTHKLIQEIWVSPEAFQVVWADADSHEFLFICQNPWDELCHFLLQLQLLLEQPVCSCDRNFHFVGNSF